MSIDTDGDRYRAFAHLTAEKRPLYRDILEAFTHARSSFTLHLRPAELQEVLRQQGREVSPLDEIEAALSQLCGWGNLQAYPDQRDVETAEAFFRVRHLYQLTTNGEAAEMAITRFHVAVEQKGELQSKALEDIQRLLGDLELLAEEEPLDTGKVYQTMDLLRTRFEGLTSRAETFMRTLLGPLDLQGINLAAFIEYKEKIIDYLDRFVEGLIVAAADVGERIRRIEKFGVQRILEAATDREVSDAMAPNSEEREKVLSLWQRRWIGFQNWFISRDGKPSQADILRSNARRAISLLLAAISGINERRISRSDRVADLKTLACWFAETETEDEAHQLWRTAFSLTPTRHIKVDQETLTQRDQTPVGNNVSWFDAPRIVVSPRLRTAGRNSNKGQSRHVVDNSKGKELLAKLAKEEVIQIEQAQVRLGARGRMRLSEIGRLDLVEFGLFLDLLGKAMGRRTKETETVEADSSDGSLHILLEPVIDGGEASVETPNGMFSGRDCVVTIRSNYDQ